MIALILFLSLWLGLLCSQNFILFIPLIVLFQIFVWKRFLNRKLIINSIVFSLLGLGLSFITISTNRTEMKGVVIESKENYYLFDSFGERFYIQEKANNKEIGDWLIVNGEQEKMEFVTLESEFDFGHYLNCKGVYKRFNVYSEKQIFSEFLGFFI